MLLLHAVRLTREKKFKVEKRCDLTRKSNKNGLIFRVDPPMGHCCTYVIVAVSFFANIQQRNCVCDVTHHVTCGPKKHTMSYRYPNIHIQIEMRSDKIGPSVGPFIDKNCGSQRHLLSILPLNALSDRVGPKRMEVERSKSYRTV